MASPLPDRNKAILDPKDFVKHVLGEKTLEFQNYHSALICFDPVCYRYLRDMQKGNKNQDLTGEVVLLDNNLLLGGLMGIGAPASVAFMEELVACGVKRFIFLGTAGRLHQNHNPAEIVICRSAYSDEGTSRCYPDWSEEIEATSVFFEQIKLFLGNNATIVKEVKSWTTDSPYMETHKKLEFYLRKGADVVEMEASALYSVAKYRRVDAAALFVISDSLVGGQWIPFFGSHTVDNAQIELAKKLLKFLV